MRNTNSHIGLYIRYLPLVIMVLMLIACSEDDDMMVHSEISPNPEIELDINSITDTYGNSIRPGTQIREPK